MMHADNFTHDFVAHRLHGLYRAASVTGRAFVAQHVFDAFASALAGHLYQAQL
ncbi:hypothetical protein D3C85_1608670 [compost metagenome]